MKGQRQNLIVERTYEPDEERVRRLLELLLEHDDRRADPDKDRLVDD